MKWKIILISILSLLILAVLAFEAICPDFSNEDYFIINRGDNILKVSSKLKADGYIKSKILFLFFSLEDDSFKKIRAGKYDLASNLSEKEIIGLITSSSHNLGEFMIIPGNSIKEIAINLERNGICEASEFKDYALDEKKWRMMENKYDFLKNIPEGGNIEGYLFPDTYRIDKNSSVEEAIDIILSNFQTKIGSLKIEGNKHKLHEIIIMASMIEKEVALEKDKKLVAGLLWKRLENGYPLEVDSTLLYFLGAEHPDVNDKNINSLYNTYKHGGLPKGPISNPSLTSIEAALNYEESDYWFYLSTPQGETIYSKSYGEHLINKAKFLNQ